VLQLNTQARFIPVLEFVRRTADTFGSTTYQSKEYFLPFEKLSHAFQEYLGEVCVLSPESVSNFRGDYDDNGLGYLDAQRGCREARRSDVVVHWLATLRTGKERT
jgi:hypothetical protein